MTSPILGGNGFLGLAPPGRLVLYPCLLLCTERALQPWEGGGACPESREFRPHSWGAQAETVPSLALLSQRPVSKKDPLPSSQSNYLEKPEYRLNEVGSL